MLSGVVADATAPAIVRATALSMITPGSTPDLATLVTRAAGAPGAEVIAEHAARGCNTDTRYDADQHRLAHVRIPPWNGATVPAAHSTLP